MLIDQGAKPMPRPSMKFAHFCPSTAPGVPQAHWHRYSTSLPHACTVMTTEAFIAHWKNNAVAYRWTDYTADMPDEEIRRLLALNLERAGQP
jgi:hypothetical protein